MILIPFSGSFKWVWVKWLIRIFFCLRWYSLKHQVLPHAAGLELDDSFLESWVGSLIEGFSLTLWGWHFQHWVFPTAASWTQWTHADPENLYAGFPGGTGVHQNWTIFYLWTPDVNYVTVLWRSWPQWVFEVALFRGRLSFAAGGSRRLVIWFPHNNTLKTFVNILLQTVQVFFAILRSGKVG